MERDNIYSNVHLLCTDSSIRLNHRFPPSGSSLILSLSPQMVQRRIEVKTQTINTLGSSQDVLLILTWHINQSKVFTKNNLDHKACFALRTCSGMEFSRSLLKLMGLFWLSYLSKRHRLHASQTFMNRLNWPETTSVPFQPLRWTRRTRKLGVLHSRRGDWNFMALWQWSVKISLGHEKARTQRGGHDLTAGHLAAKLSLHTGLALLRFCRSLCDPRLHLAAQQEKMDYNPADFPPISSLSTSAEAIAVSTRLWYCAIPSSSLIQSLLSYMCHLSTQPSLFWLPKVLWTHSSCSLISFTITSSFVFLFC